MPTDRQVAGGHKANLNNPNTSKESKENSKQVLDNEFNGGDGACLTWPLLRSDLSHLTSCACLQSPVPTTTRTRTLATSPVASRREFSTAPHHPADAQSPFLAADIKTRPNNRTLKNPNVSDEAKESAKERLNQI